MTDRADELTFDNILGVCLRANKLRIIDTLCESSTQFIANKQSVKDAWKRKKMGQVVMLLKGALAANNMVGLKLNIEEKNLKSALAKLPALKNPTVAPLSREGWVAIETVIDESVVRTIIPALKEAGAPSRHVHCSLSVFFMAFAISFISVLYLRSL
jgi:ATP phosphoribosyltransferase